MKIKEINPPREFEVGTINKTMLRDCAHIFLDNDEQITLFTDDGAEYDIARKSWGYYATPSINKRLKSFGLKTVLTKGMDDKFFIQLVQEGKDKEFADYAKLNGLKIVCWLDNEQNLKKIDKSFEINKTICPFCDSSVFSLIFHYDKLPKGETNFQISPEGYKREILQCNNCKHLINKHNIDLDNIYKQNYVNSTYGDKKGVLEKFNKIMSLPNEKSDNYYRVKRIVEYMKNEIKDSSRKPTVLDVGSGLCVFLKRMKDEGWECTALDPDQRAIEHAKEIVGVNGICDDFMNSKDFGSYDLITFNKVLEHVRDPVAMLKLAHKYLNKSGVVYVEVPDGEVAMNDGPEREEFFIEHYHIFSLASLSLLAQQAGFSVLLIERLQEPSTKYTLRAFLKQRTKND